MSGVGTITQVGGVGCGLMGSGIAEVSARAGLKEPLYAPPPMLSRIVDAGLLGRKSGRGFHQYA